MPLLRHLVSFRLVAFDVGICQRGGAPKRQPPKELKAEHTQPPMDLLLAIKETKVVSMVTRRDSGKACDFKCEM